MREETEYRLKPMVEVGGHPVLWHLMKIFAAHNLTDFVICTGYRGEIIKEYFLNYGARVNEFTLTAGKPESITYHNSHDDNGWTMTVADTGATTMTGGRVKQVQKYMDGRCMVNYGAGLV